MIAAFLFDIHTSSLILRSASICGIVERPLLNPFWFLLSKGSTWSAILSIKKHWVLDLGCNIAQSDTSVVGRAWEITFLRQWQDRRMRESFWFVSRFRFIAKVKQVRVEQWWFPNNSRNFIRPGAFRVSKLLHTSYKFFHFERTCFNRKTVGNFVGKECIFRWACFVDFFAKRVIWNE